MVFMGCFRKIGTLKAMIHLLGRALLLERARALMSVHDNAGGQTCRKKKDTLEEQCLGT